MTAPLRILAIPGSLRARSTNLLLLETAAKAAPRNMQVDIFAGLADIPLFNPDVADAPPAVVSLRSAIQSADAVILSAPEYAHGVPGALKNALDWLVSGIELAGKPVALFNASARSVYAQTALREVLVTMGASFLDAACVTVTLLAEDRSAALLAADPSIVAPLTVALERIAIAVPNRSATVTAQPIGPALPHWKSRPHPERRSFVGRYSNIEPLDAPRHAGQLYNALCTADGAAGWTYLSTSPPSTIEEWQEWVERSSASRDPLFYAIIDENGEPAGMSAYLRIAPEHGSIEIGHIHLSPSLQQTRAATEAQYLLMRYVFDDLGYRRYEWKCDALNHPSRRAAQRLGFRFEGIFLNAVVYKGRSRDTAWFSITDAEWPVVRRAFESWLASENFDPEGRQLRSLANLRQQERG